MLPEGRRGLMLWSGWGGGVSVIVSATYAPPGFLKCRADLLFSLSLQENEFSRPRGSRGPVLFNRLEILILCAASR